MSYVHRVKTTIFVSILSEDRDLIEFGVQKSERESTEYSCHDHKALIPKRGSITVANFLYWKSLMVRDGVSFKEIAAQTNLPFNENLV
jgi:hypothetical protein